MQMTKNEYKDYMKECASRFWKDPEYTKEKMDADLDAVEILPLNLGRFNLPPEMESNINKLFDEETTDRKGNYMLCGFTRIEMAEVHLLGVTIGSYGDAISFYGYNDKELLIYTFYEGDTTLKLFTSTQDYEKEKQETEDWYKEAYT